MVYSVDALPAVVKTKRTDLTVPDPTLCVYGINLLEHQLHPWPCWWQPQMQHSNWEVQEMKKLPLAQTSAQFLTGREVQDSGLCASAAYFPGRQSHHVSDSKLKELCGASHRLPNQLPVIRLPWNQSEWVSGYCSQWCSSHSEQPGASLPSLEQEAGVDNHQKCLPTSNILCIEWFCQFRKMNQQCSQN